jgi:hypothetical protein
MGFKAFQYRSKRISSIRINNVIQDFNLDAGMFQDCPKIGQPQRRGGGLRKGVERVYEQDTHF